MRRVSWGFDKHRPVHLRELLFIGIVTRPFGTVMPQPVRHRQQHDERDESKRQGPERLRNPRDRSEKERCGGNKEPETHAPQVAPESRRPPKPAGPKHPPIAEPSPKRDEAKYHKRNSEARLVPSRGDDC